MPIPDLLTTKDYADISLRCFDKVSGFTLTKRDPFGKVDSIAPLSLDQILEHARLVRDFALGRDEAEATAVKAEAEEGSNV